MWLPIQDSLLTASCRWQRQGKLIQEAAATRHIGHVSLWGSETKPGLSNADEVCVIVLLAPYKLSS